MVKSSTIRSDLVLKNLEIMTNRIVQFFLLSFLVSICYSSNLNAQVAGKESAPLVSNPAFDRTIDRLISHTVPLIDVKTLSKDMDKYLLLDARERSEYEVSHLEGALYIGYDHWSIAVLDGVDKDQPIVVYCSIGVRSEKIGEQLQQAGYRNVKNLYGSIFEWVNQSYPLVDKAGYPTKNIHAYNWLWGKWVKNDLYKKVYR